MKQDTFLIRVYFSGEYISPNVKILETNFIINALTIVFSQNKLTSETKNNITYTNIYYINIVKGYFKYILFFEEH